MWDNMSIEWEDETYVIGQRPCKWQASSQLMNLIDKYNRQEPILGGSPPLEISRRAPGHHCRDWRKALPRRYDSRWLRAESTRPCSPWAAAVWSTRSATKTASPKWPVSA
jgi:hypothetical protein